MCATVAQAEGSEAERPMMPRRRGIVESGEGAGGRGGGDDGAGVGERGRSDGFKVSVYLPHLSCLSDGVWCGCIKRGHRGFFLYQNLFGGYIVSVYLPFEIAVLTS